MDPQRSKEILSLLHAYYGDVRPDLSFRDIYQLIIAVVLSAQTTDKQVNAVTPHLFSKYPDFAHLADARQKDVEKIIRRIGFFRVKAKHIIALSRFVVEHHGGKIPNTREELMKLPGVGRKSANVILSVGFGIPALAVDTHIVRIANRIGYASSQNPRSVEDALTSVIPKNEWNLTHLLLIRHGRTLCTARNPKCHHCPINAHCAFFYIDHKKQV